MSRLLIIDDDKASCRTLLLHFGRQGHDVCTAHSVEDGLAAARSCSPDLVVLDIRLPGRDGLDGLVEFRRMLPDAPVIMITAFHDMESTIQAMQGGAQDYIHKPIDIGELDTAVARGLTHRPVGDYRMSSGNKRGPASMAGRSAQMREVFKLIGRVAAKPVTVLIGGESGTGKELVARAIHAAGTDPGGPFVPVNCAALVESLLESDLFGHEKGAFTGAVARRPGKFALAAGGTIFLDEVGELTPNVQAKLLRVLQEGEYAPLGGTTVQQSDARVIAATNADLQQRVIDGRFREDLLYRLRVVSVEMPPLRERKEDLFDLVQALLARINEQLDQKVNRVALNVMEAFRAYHWPGNVRELENVLMKAVALAPGDAITRELLPQELLAAANDMTGEDDVAELQSLDDVERRHVQRVLKANDWHRGRACEVLGVSRPRLRRMMRLYRLEPPAGKDSDTGGAGG